MAQIKKRAQKVSKGTGVGARKSPQTKIALVLMGKGLAHKSKSKKRTIKA